MYDYADKIIAYLTAIYINLFNRLKSETMYSEAEVFHKVNNLFDELNEQTQVYLTVVASQAFESAGGKGNRISRQWLIVNVLDNYDPVTKYVFTNEVDRKRSRLAESLIASPNRAEEIATALRYWVAMVSQYVITTVDCATIEAYKTQGVTEVVWVSVKDKSRCVVCKQREGKVYPIDNIPPKPHIGCRCYFLPKGR